MAIATISNGEAGSSVRTKLNQLVDRANQNTGWVQITDATYTSGSPFAVTASTRTKLDLNSDSVIESHAPDGTNASTFYNAGTKKILTGNIGDAYIFRLNFTIDPAQTNAAFDLELDIGNGSEVVILERSTALTKGTNPYAYTTSNLYYTLNTFDSNGGELFITPNVNVDIYDMSLVIARIHQAR